MSYGIWSSKMRLASTRIATAAMKRIDVRMTNHNDGRRIGLVQIDDYLRILSNEAGGGLFENMTDSVCTVALPACSMLTLRSGTDGTHWLWADDRHLSSGGQARLGDLARDRARNNPF